MVQIPLWFNDCCKMPLVIVPEVARSAILLIPFSITILFDIVVEKMYVFSKPVVLITMQFFISELIDYRFFMLPFLSFISS